jgi:hypothetical protein
MMRRLLPSALVAFLLAGGQAVAHHAIAAIYDSSKQVTLDGIVNDFQFINPHPIVVIEVEKSGRKETWRLEMDNRGELSAVGMRGDTLRPGDRVVVKGGMARDQSRALYIRRLERPADGFWYEQVGSSPKVGSRGGSAR